MQRKVFSFANFGLKHDDQSCLRCPPQHMLAMALPRAHVFGLLILFFFSLPGVLGGNCSSISKPARIETFSGSSVLYLYGNHGTLYSAIGGKNRSDSFFVTIKSVGLAERLKVVPQNPRDSCITPDEPFAEKTPGDRFVSPIVKFADASNFDCYMWTETKNISGVEVRGAYINVTTPDLPGYYGIQAFEFAAEEFEIVPSNDTTNTNGLLVSYHYLYATRFPLFSPSCLFRPI